MIRLVTWDWNGTLLADTEAGMAAGNHVIETFGGNPLPRDEYTKVFDFPALEFYCGQHADREKMVTGDYSKVFHDYYETRAAQCRTRRGAREVLSWLNENSVDSVILSNHINGAIERQLKRLDIEKYFKAILANDDLGLTVSGRNKIHRMRDYLSQKHIDPSQTIIIGDCCEDIEIGKALDMRTVGVTGGYFSTPRLRASKPNYLISNLSGVIDIIQGS